MPYLLTLTRDECEAMDWIGNRYFWGHDLQMILLDCPTDTPEDYDSDDYPDETTWAVPENLAWEIREGIDAEGTPCAGDVLRHKLIRFLDSIV